MKFKKWAGRPVQAYRLPQSSPLPPPRHMRLRETANFIAAHSARGVRITAKDRGASPRSRVIRTETFEAMQSMSDDSFDGTCVMDLGIGVFALAKKVVARLLKKGRK